MFFGRDKQTMPEPDQALPGRSEAVPVQPAHLVLGTPLDGPVPARVVTTLLTRSRERALRCFELLYLPPEQYLPPDREASYTVEGRNSA